MQSHKTQHIYLLQNETLGYVQGHSCPRYFENIPMLWHSLLLLCKYVVSRLQHNIDKLYVDNTVNDRDFLYCAVCYALNPQVYSRGKVFAFTSTRV